MIRGRSGFIHSVGEIRWRVTKPHTTHHTLTAAPADDDAVLIVHIQIRAACERAAARADIHRDIDRAGGHEIAVIVRGSGGEAVVASGEA